MHMQPPEDSILRRHFEQLQASATTTTAPTPAATPPNATPAPAAAPATAITEPPRPPQGLLARLMSQLFGR